MSGLLPQLVRYIVLGFLFSLAAIVGIRVLTGEINTRGLLRTKSPTGEDSISPARVQLLVFTLAAAGNFLTDVLNAPGSATLPEVPQSMLATLGGSHVFYLGSKAVAFLSKTQRASR